MQKEGFSGPLSLHLRCPRECSACGFLQHPPPPSSDSSPWPLSLLVPPWQDPVKLSGVSSRPHGASCPFSWQKPLYLLRWCLVRMGPLGCEPSHTVSWAHMVGSQESRPFWAWVSVDTAHTAQAEKTCVKRGWKTGKGEEARKTDQSRVVLVFTHFIQNPASWEPSWCQAGAVRCPGETVVNKTRSTL